MNRINNYEELVTERRRLENQISDQKLTMKNEFSGLKGKLEPFLNLLPVLNVFRTKNKTSYPLFSAISSLGIDLVGQRLLSKTSWITRFIVPLIAKGVTSRMISPDKVSKNADVQSLTS